ncbi:hypothetical protein ScPMuIL_012100 [Solemya velum]
MLKVTCGNVVGYLWECCRLLVGMLQFIWLAANIVYFIVTFFTFHNAKNYFYLRLIIGPSLGVARGSAAGLNLNCMLILIPVCRNLISFLRGSFKKCCRRNIRRQLDNHLTFHMYIAYAICIHTAIHIGAHVFNVERFLDSWDSQVVDDAEVKDTILRLSQLRTDAYLNPIAESADTTDTIREMFKTVAGVSGVVITLSLILIVTSSTETIRRSYFEIFWYTHHLFIPFFIATILHGIQGIVRYQTNIDEHDPEKCWNQEWIDDLDSEDSDEDDKCPTPLFEGNSPKSWMWVLGPMVIYFLERAVRFYRSKQQVVVMKVVKHPSKVFELQMKRSGFEAGPGQYVFVQAPGISALEWHPFTLTSAPDDDYFSVHIRRVGDWTEALAQECHVDKGEFQEAWKMPRIAIDGPFGTPTEDIFWYQVDVFVAAGIGVTPFASVLKHIWYKHCASEEMKLKKVYLYWVCPDTNAFEWMQDLLQHFDQQMLERGNTDFLDYNIYLTRGWDSNQAHNIVLNEEEGRDAVTGLQQKTHFGRPQWDKIFPSLVASHPGTNVGVFLCGPTVLANSLHKLCNTHSSNELGGIKFFFNKETF